MRTAIPALALLLLAAGCGKVERSIHAELDADFASGRVLLACTASSSGTCYAVFLQDGQAITGQAAAGNTSEIEGVGEGADYCVAVSPPAPNQCHPRPLSPGKQIVRSSTVRT